MVRFFRTIFGIKWLLTFELRVFSKNSVKGTRYENILAKEVRGWLKHDEHSSNFMFQLKHEVPGWLPL